MKWLKWVAGTAIGTVFLWLSLGQGHLSELMDCSVQFDGGYLLCGRDAPLMPPLPPPSAVSGWQVSLYSLAQYLFALTLIHFLRVLRWMPLIQHLTRGRATFKEINAISAVGFMAMFLLPFRLGELARPVLLGRRLHIPMAALLATVVLERIADGLIVVGLLYLALSNTRTLFDSPEQLELGAWLSLMVFSGALAGLFLLFAASETLARWTKTALSSASERLGILAEEVILRFAKGLQALPDMKSMLTFSSLSVLYWVINGLAIGNAAEGFGLNIGPWMGFNMMACVVIGMMIPNSPGNVGTFWFFLLLPLHALGDWNQPQVTVFGISIYFCQLLQQGGLGLWYLVRAPSANKITL